MYSNIAPLALLAGLKSKNQGPYPHPPPPLPPTKFCKQTKNLYIPEPGIPDP